VNQQTSSPRPGSRYEPSADSPLFIVAMDHRASFAHVLFGVDGAPTEAERAKMRDSKMVIYEGACKAVADGLATGCPGVLVDEELGPEVARRAKADGFVLAMPIEKSGTQLFELEYGDRYAEHVKAFDPDFFKVLVRYNPADEPDARAVQIERLAEVSTWATASEQRWLFELLVPPTREQLAQSEDQFHFDRGARPKLTAEAIGSFNAGGVHPTVWKLEGYETTDGAQQVLRAVADDAPSPAECIVLGRNAPLEQVEHWIDVAAPLPGFAGFAVGRSIWESALADLIAGRIERHQAATVIADRYRRLIDGYCAARLPGAGGADRTEPFTSQNPRLTPDRENRIRQSLQGADMRGTRLPAWMAASLLAEVDALRAEKGYQAPGA
jgi:myo-inositol catabolism protein IolC